MKASSLPKGLLANRYRIIGGIGQGCYGTVFKAVDQDTGQIVALKQVKIFHECDSLPVSYYRETGALQALSNENIVKLENTINEDYTLYLVLEYCEFDLAALISKGLSVQQTKWYMSQLLRAVSLMHDQQFVHRDLKPNNVYITRNNVVKLGDFGLARKLPPRQKLTSDVVTVCYKSPELLLEDHNYGSPIDVWSLGCLLFEMITGRILFTTTSATSISQLNSIYQICGSPTDGYLTTLPGYQLTKPKEEIRSILHDFLLTQIPPEYLDIVDLLEAMLVLDPTQRISVKECLAHPFFADLEQPGLLTLPDLHAADVMYKHIQTKPKVVKGKKQPKFYPTALLRAAPMVPICAF